MKKTRKEIDDEIRKLDACKKYAPRMSMFGGNNHANIDLQISVLADDTSQDLAYDRFADPDELDAALEAILWRDGESDTIPSAGWDNHKPKE